MRVIFTICLFLFSFEMNAQVSIDSNVDSVRYQKKSSDVKIGFRCRATGSVSSEPLLIVDGVLVEFGKLKDLIPDDIESIAVLKNSNATAIYGCRAMNGVIIITTKKARLRRFLVSDLLDGSNLVGATVSFISVGDKKDTLMFVSNDSGLITTDKLNAGAEYKITITSAGYKTLSVTYKNTNTTINSFSLQRDVINCAPVVVSAGCGIRCHRIVCCCRVQRKSIYNFIATKNVLDKSVPVRVYPNPVQPGRNLTIEFNSYQEGLLYTNLIAIDGRQLLSQAQKTYQGRNILSLDMDSRWPAGVYFIQVTDEKRNVLKHEKIVISN